MINYNMLLIATGRSPAQAEWDACKTKGIFYLRSLDNADAERFFRAERVVVKLH